MTIDAALREALEEHFGGIESASPVSGGSIASAFDLRLADGGRIFAKVSSTSGPVAMEADGLARLRAVAGSRIGVPQVLGTGRLPEGTGWLALPWIDVGTLAPGDWAGFGRDLGGLHAESAGPEWGLDEDNWIGSLPQANGPLAEWSEFWWARRLEPQLRWASAAGIVPGRTAQWRELETTLPERLAAAGDDGPSLLHGDLWNGNVLGDRSGRPWLIDPAVYHGHREVDLAMADLFGGFPGPFWKGYEERNPLQAGFQGGRKAIYQLYYLLVHVNLFGAGYLGRTEDALRRAVGAR